MSNVGNINVQIGVDISNALNNFKQLEQQATATATNIQNAFKGIFNTGGSGDILAGTQKSALTIQQALKNSARGLNSGGRTISDYFNKTLSSSLTIKNTISSMTQNASQNAVNFRNNMTTGTNTAVKNTKTMAQNFSQMKSDFASLLVSGTMLKNMGSNYLSSIYEPYKAMAKERTYADFLYNYTDNERSQMNKIVDAQSSSFGISQDEIWNAYNKAGSSSISKQNSVTAVQGALKLNRVAQIDTTDGLDIANIMNKAFGNDNIDNMAVIYDKLATTQKVANVQQLDELKKGLKRYSFNFAQSGVSLDDYLATMSMATYSSTADEASRTNNSIIRSLSKPQKGSIEYADSLGINFATATEDYIGFLETVNNMDLNTTQLQKLFGNDLSKRGFTALTSNMETLKEMRDEIANSEGLLDSKMLELEAEGWYQLEKAQNSFETAKVSLMESLAPLLQDFSFLIGNLSEKIKNLSPETKRMISYFAIGAVVLGGFLVVAGTLGLLLSSIGSIFTTVGSIIGIFGKLLSGLGTFITTTIIPTFMNFGITGLISSLAPIAGFVALGYAMLTLQNNFGGFTNWFKGIWISVQGIFFIVLRGILQGIDWISRSINDVMSKFSAFGSLSKTLRKFGADDVADKLEGFNVTTVAGDGFSSAIQGGLAWIDGQAERLSVENAEVSAKANVSNWSDLKNFDWNPFDDIVASAKAKVSGLFEKFDFGSELNGLLSEWDGEGNGLGLTPDLAEAFDSNEDLLDTLYPSGSGSSGSSAIDAEASKYAQGVEQIEDSIKSLTDTFKDSIGMFDKFTKKIISSASLLNKNKNRATAFADWKIAQETLMGNANLSIGTKEEISNMGVDKLAELQALMRMSGEQLREWDSYNRQIENDSKDIAIQSTYYNQITVKMEGLDVKAISEAIYKEMKRKGLV